MPFSAQCHVFQNSPTYSPLSRSLPPRNIPFELHSENTSSALAAKDLELLHHYYTTTSLTLSEQQPAQKAWQTVIPQLAFSHPLVAHGLLATASLHLSRLRDNSTEKELFLNRAASHLNTGIALFRDAVQNITRQNCDALFALTTFITVFIFASARDDCGSLIASALAHPDQKSPDAGAIHLAVRLLRTIRGALVVLTPAWNWVAQGPISAICTRAEWPEHPQPANAQAIEEDEKLAALSSLWETPKNSGIYSDILSDALKSLQLTFARVSLLTLVTTDSTDCDRVDHSSGLKDRGAAFVWPIAISEKYLVLLEKQQPGALVLLAHYAILLDRVPNCWWIEGVAAYLVASAALVLGTERRSWIAWPIRAVRPEGIEMV